MTWVKDILVPIYVSSLISCEYPREHSLQSSLSVIAFHSISILNSDFLIRCICLCSCSSCQICLSCSVSFSMSFVVPLWGKFVYFRDFSFKCSFQRKEKDILGILSMKCAPGCKKLLPASFICLSIQFLVFEVCSFILKYSNSQRICSQHTCGAYSNNFGSIVTLVICLDLPFMFSFDILQQKCA